MLTVIIKRTDEPKVIQLTQENIMRELGQFQGAEMLLEDRWQEGLKKVRTMYVCLVEADCTLSASYLSSNCRLLHKSLGANGEGGNISLAMMSSCLGIDRFDNRIYHYHMEPHTDEGKSVSITTWQPTPFKKKTHTAPYQAQIGFVPGAIIRYTSIKDIIDTFDWDDDNLVRMSTKLSFHMWNTNRTLKVNPNTTYVSTQKYLGNPPDVKVNVPHRVDNLFQRHGL